MTGCDVLRADLEQTRLNLHTYLADFTDAELLVRPVPGANHAAWQIGNVIAGDVYLVRTEWPDAKFPELPAGFNDLHGSKGAKQDGPAGFLTKADYLQHFDAVRAATIAHVAQLTDADLDRPAEGIMKDYAPTKGEVLLVVANHTLMHVGQFTVIRRLLGKPVLF